MAVYVDKLVAYPAKGRGVWKYRTGCHMIADTDEELHKFAAFIGLRRSWHQTNTLSHYDLTENMRGDAVRNGAIEIDRQELVRRIQNARKANNERNDKAD